MTQEQLNELISNCEQVTSDAETLRDLAETVNCMTAELREALDAEERADAKANLDEARGDFNSEASDLGEQLVGTVADIADALGVKHA